MNTQKLSSYASNFYARLNAYQNKQSSTKFQPKAQKIFVKTGNTEYFISIPFSYFSSEKK